MYIKMSADHNNNGQSNIIRRLRGLQICDFGLQSGLGIQSLSADGACQVVGRLGGSFAA